MFYSVKFNRFNGCRSSRSELQISMDVIRLVPLFKVSLKFKSRDFRCVLVMINAARFIETSCFGVHPYLWHLQRGLFLDTHEPMWRMREMFLRIESSLVKFSNANIDQFISILCIEGCEFGCQQCSGNAPVDMVNLLDRRLLAAVGLKHCSGRQWPKDVNFNGYTLW